MDGLTWAISRFDNKDLAFAIAFGILAAAFAIWAFLYFSRHRPWVRPIRKLAVALRTLRGDGTDATGRLVKADEVFESEPDIEPLWREYRKHLQPDPQAHGYLNLVDPRFWFSVESLPGRGYEHWCATWAGVFLTVGLLFTFVGLSAALLKVGSINGADSAAMKAAITGILGVSSAKFITSIAGLIAYIGFSLITRHYQSIQHAAARDLADAVQHLSLPLTPELLLYEQNDTARRQLMRMERLTDDLAVAIDGKLEQRLRTLAADFGQQLGTIQHDLPSATVKPIVDAIQNMSQTVAQEFSKQVQQTAGGQIDTVAERFAAVAVELARIKDGMGGAGDAFGRDIRIAATELRDAAGKMGQGLDLRSKELGQIIGQFGGTLDTISTTLGTVPGNIDRALNTTLDRLADAIGALVNRLAEGGESGATALTAGCEEAGDRLKASASQAGQDLKETIGAVGVKLDSIAGALGQVPDDISRALSGTLTKLTAAVDQLTGRLAEGGRDGGDALREGGQQAGAEIERTVVRAGSEFDRLVTLATSKLVEQFAAAQTGLETAIQDLASRLQTVESSLKTAGQTVTGASSALEQATQPVLQIATTMGTSIDQIRQGVADAAMIQNQTSQAVQLALDGLKKAADAAERTFKTHEDRFGHADEALANALSGLRDGVEQVTKATQGVFAEYETHISSAVGSLGAVAAELQEAAEELVAAR